MSSLNQIKEEIAPIIIYGAAVVGRAVYKVCKNADIPVAAFCDEQRVETPEGIPLVSPTRLHDVYPDAVFIICTTHAQDAIANLQKLNYETWYLAGNILTEEGCPVEFTQPNSIYDEQIIERCVVNHSIYSDGDTLYASSIDLLITERCTMKCRDCCNLMQYFQSPQDVSVEDVLSHLDLIEYYFDSVHELRIIGGEALLHPSFPEIIKRCTNSNTYNSIVVYTNATIIPNQKKIAAMSHPKVILAITDYGPSSVNLKRLVDISRKNNINYHVTKVGGWTECSSITRHYRTKNDNDDLFSSCCVKHTSSISDGTLYRCPFIANAIRLGAIPATKTDGIDLASLRRQQPDKTTAQTVIRSFLKQTSHFPGCDYCTGRSYGKENIEPAIQTKQPLPYTKLT